MIEITEIRTRPLRYPDRTLANVKLVLNDLVTLRVRVMRGGYVKWPKVKNLIDTLGPLDPGAAREANELILEQYVEEVEKGR